MEKREGFTELEEQKEYFVKNTLEIQLSSGKTVVLRERKGQHHIIESRLLSTCAQPSGQEGINIGELILASEIKVAVAIAEIDGKKIKLPTCLRDVFELADLFTYEEWDELKYAMEPNKEEIEKAAKNLQTGVGFGKESV